MEETSEELPNFSIGIDLLGPDPTSSINKASNYWPKDIHWEQKRHQLAINNI